jgi:solute carrier family 6 amino acid/orphan transporter-like 15/16/17/18/20
VHLFDSYAVAPAILIVCFFEIIGVMYVYGKSNYNLRTSKIEIFVKKKIPLLNIKGCDRFCDDIYAMLKIRPSKFWVLCWKYISPGIVLVITILFSIDILL